MWPYSVNFKVYFPRTISWICNYNDWEWLKPWFLSIFIQDSNMQHLTMAHEHFWHYAYNFYWYLNSSLSQNAGVTLYHKNVVTNLRLEKTKAYEKLGARGSHLRENSNIQSMVFWLVTPHSLVSQHVLEDQCCLHRRLHGLMFQESTVGTTTVVKTSKLKIV